MSEFILQIEKLAYAIGDPEYRFILMEPLIFYGILFGIIIFITSFLMRIVKFQTVALIVVALAALAHIPYTKARDQAQPRMEQVYKISSPSRVKMFKANTVEWKEGAWVYLILAVVAGATILVGGQRNRLGFALSAATVFFGLMGIKNSLWLHYQDSLAYHPNLKMHEAPIEKKRKTASAKVEVPSTNSSTSSVIPLSTRRVTPVNQLNIPARTPSPAPNSYQPTTAAIPRPAALPPPAVASTTPQQSYTRNLSTQQTRPAAPITTNSGRISHPRPPVVQNVPQRKPSAPVQPIYQAPMPTAPPVQYQPPLPVR